MNRIKPRPSDLYWPELEMGFETREYMAKEDARQAAEQRKWDNDLAALPLWRRAFYWVFGF